MALSNKFGLLVLTTGNKSELACGYSTLYGDMAGGFAVIKDCPKTLVYKLSEYRNSISPVIPESIITRPPSAELRPDQKDSDTLPPYEVLDPILEAYVEEDRRHQRDRRDGLRRSHRRPRSPNGRPQRIQTPPARARRKDHAEGLRQGQKAADYEWVSGVGFDMGDG